jgi:hypothetical protein
MVRPGEASSVLETATMEQPIHQAPVTRAAASDRLSPDRTPDDLAIFSAPGVGVVMHWWAESNRRWAERDQSKARTVRAEEFVR